MPYLVDGHNLIPRAGLRLDSVDDELELVALLQGFARASRRKVEVYFDGAPADNAGTRRFGLVTAHFVAIGSTADFAIKARLATLGGAARNWIVVTSDRDLQRAAAALHARVQAADQFAAAIDAIRQRGSANEPSSDQGPLAESEVQNWLQIFRSRRSN
jgi:predicted RNA-binding protein with PIN domain